MTGSPVVILLALSSVALLAAPPQEVSFEKTVQPFLAQKCYMCHNGKMKSGDLDLAALKAVTSVAHDPEIWEKISHRLMDGTMPPKGMPPPKQADVQTITNWINEEVKRVELAQKPDPGRVTARRLNRAEYNNTIRDLLGVDFRPADDFPQDDSGYGFDNIGDVLSLSPVLLEKYLKAAESVVNTALFGPEKLKPMAIRSQPPGHEFPLLPKAEEKYDITGLSMPNSLHAQMKFPAAGTYTVRIALEGRRPNGSEPLEIGIWLDGKQIGSIPIDAPSDGGSIDLFGAQGEVKLHLPAGEHWIAASLLHLYEGLPPSYGGQNPTKRKLPPPPDVSRFLKIPPDATPEQIAELKKKALERMERNKVPANRVWVHFVEALGPYDQKTGPVLETRQKLLPCTEQQPGCAQKALSQFARRAFRRSVTPVELQPYLKLVADTRRGGANFDRAMATGFQAMLVSPDFLFRMEKAETTGTAEVQPVQQFALASRISYFLWSSMPDEELLRAAEQKTLRNPAVLTAQVKRMLKDPKAKALVENFAGQWLELRRLESVAPDREKFPNFDDYLRMSMKQETELFFANLMKNDLSITDLVDAPYSFLNEKLAKFYGIQGVEGPEFRKVDMTGSKRSGVLTQASILTVSSYATRTSPVLRGKWILENFLNEPIPPPPPNVPALDEAKIGAAAALRQQMEEHRANPACASCHAKMDPVGFGFENFDAIGQWRTKDGKFDIDSSGALPDGRSFQGAEDLKRILSQDRTKFGECVSDKLLTYALGRGLERFDRRTVKEIAKNAEANNYRFSSLVLEVIRSLPFQMTRKEKSKS
ncbi:DUF1592 domain-containing protein [Bryobacter aggregatus]|uniref:DUF1592 domain-containing protein n=1 Tax=Bryobacter aggregatus TaxID=360054 RepID=UPI0004E1158B|nr:DUF1592 domain-containing protein [Bryobacter aggregatus]